MGGRSDLARLNSRRSACFDIVIGEVRDVCGIAGFVCSHGSTEGYRAAIDQMIAALA